MLVVLGVGILTYIVFMAGYFRGRKSKEHLKNNAGLITLFRPQGGGTIINRGF